MTNNGDIYSALPRLRVRRMLVAMVFLAVLFASCRHLRMLWLAVAVLTLIGLQSVVSFVVLWVSSKCSAD